MVPNEGVACRIHAAVTVLASSLGVQGVDFQKSGAVFFQNFSATLSPKVEKFHAGIRRNPEKTLL